MKSIDQCKSEFPRGKEILVDGVPVYVRKPKYVEWRAFMAAQTATALGRDVDGIASVDAMEHLAKACCVSHTAEELDKLVDEYLNAFQDIGAAATELGRTGAEERASKSR